MSHSFSTSYNLAMNAMSDQLKRLRRHPSVVLFLYSSDQLPTEHVEAGYLNVFKEEKWAVGKVNSAADTYSPLSGHSGVKMAGSVAKQIKQTQLSKSKTHYPTGILTNVFLREH